ncbi:hypothetical protein ACFCYH_32760 [Streptomyces sp. NPDC056400]|uniref:hypothetical protein n=1 Tax=Streptomyces sp. NPDC056400 TaxID=3345808 RepID=UPI0035DD0051
MRRASPTGTGTPAEPGRRWTATGIAGAAAGAAAVGFGGPYAVGLLLTGEEVATGTKVRGVAMGGMSRDEARQTLDRALGPVAAAPVALRIGDALAGPLRQAAPGPVAARLRLDGAGGVTLAEEGEAGRQVTEPALSAAVLPLLTGAGTAGRTGEVATEAAAPRLTKDTAGQPAVRTGGGPKCEPQSPLEGFDVAVDRVFVQGGKEVGWETMKTRYTPRDRVTCGA